jgi:carbon starvation protein
MDTATTGSWHKTMRRAGWFFISFVGAGALGAVALYRDEPINAMWLIVASVCIYLVGYRFYSRFISLKVLELDDRRATPAERLDDGRDFVPTNKWVLLGHHFAAIAGPGPLVGPTLAAQLGYLPGTLWIVIGAVLGGSGLRPATEAEIRIAALAALLISLQM